jgi:hypothetical protein
MKLLGNDGSLVLEILERGAAGTQGDGDVRLKASVNASGFTAKVQNWVIAEAWISFLAELRTLEQQRQGRAALVSASPDDLRLEFVSTDRAGHMAVQGQVHTRTVERFELLLRFGFTFEPYELPRVLDELEGMV